MIYFVFGKNDLDYIEPVIHVILPAGRRKIFCRINKIRTLCGADAQPRRQLLCGKRRFNLNKGNRASFFCDYIYLLVSNTVIALKNAVPVQAQINPRKALAPCAHPLLFAPVFDIKSFCFQYPALLFSNSSPLLPMFGFLFLMFGFPNADVYF